MPTIAAPPAIDQLFAKSETRKVDPRHSLLCHDPNAVPDRAFVNPTLFVFGGYRHDPDTTRLNEALG